MKTWVWEVVPNLCIPRTCKNEGLCNMGLGMPYWHISLNLKNREGLSQQTFGRWKLLALPNSCSLKPAKMIWEFHKVMLPPTYNIYIYIYKHRALGAPYWHYQTHFASFSLQKRRKKKKKKLCCLEYEGLGQHKLASGRGITCIRCMYHSSQSPMWAGGTKQGRSHIVRWLPKSF